MRILLANTFPLDGSGSGTYCAEVAAALVRGGHDVLALAPDHTVHVGYPFPVRTLICSNGSATHVDTADLSFSFPCFTSHPRSTLTFGELDAAKIAAYVDTWRSVMEASVEGFRPDVIHANHTWILPFVAATMGLPYVITCHGTDLLGLRCWPQYGTMAREGVADASAIIAISAHIRDEILAHFPSSDRRVHLIPNGFDPAVFRLMPDRDNRQTLAAFGLDAFSGPVVVFAGKLTAEKRVDMLLRAAALYEPQIADVRTLIAGAGPLEDELRALAGTLGLRGVSFLGHQPHARLAPLYNAADVCAFPSRCEPFGLVALEAMACGSPVVVTNAGGFPDFVNDSVGALVPVNDPTALAAAIAAEIRQGSKATKGVYAAAHALAVYPWEQHASKLLRLYEQASEGAAA